MGYNIITFDRFARWILIAAGVATLFLLVNRLSNVLLPFFVAWLLAYLLYPLVTFIQYRLKVKNRAASILLAILLVTTVIVGIAWLIIPPMIEQFQKLGTLTTQYLQQRTHIADFPTAISEWISENEHNIANFFQRDDVTDAIKSAMPKVVNFLSQTANIIISIIASMITLLYMFFILLDYETLSKGFIKMAPKKVRPFWQGVINDVEHELDNYVRGQSLVALCMGILFCIGFTIIDFPMAIGLGILIGIMDLVPYLHSLALIPTVFLAALKAADTGQNFWIILISALAVFAIVQVICDMIVTPKIMGKAMGLNPAILLLSLSVWGALFGFIGLIIALPLTTLIIAYYQRYVTKEAEISEKTQKIAE